MAGPSDTSPEARRVLDEVYRSMPAWRKWEVVEEVHRFGRDLHAAALRDRITDPSPSQLRDDWMTRLYGAVPSVADAPEPTPEDSPTPIRATVEYVVDVLDRLGIAYALGGSLASSLYGVSRNTIDADLCVEPFHGREDAFAASFGPAFSIGREAGCAAVRDRASFTIIQTVAGFKVDVFVRKDRPFEAAMMARRRSLMLPGPDARPITVVSPEDIVLLKLERYRLGNEVSDRQWSDVLGVLRVQAGRLDEAYLDRWAADLNLADLLARARGEVATPD